MISTTFSLSGWLAALRLAWLGSRTQRLCLRCCLPLCRLFALLEPPAHFLTPSLLFRAEPHPTKPPNGPAKLTRAGNAFTAEV